MIQTFRSSRLSSSLQNLRREKGILAPSQSQRTRTKILHQYKENIYMMLSSHNNILDSTDVFRSSCNKRRTYRNQLIQTFGTTSDGEFVIEPNDDKKVAPRNNIWAKWDAFYRFCHLYTATGVVIAVCSIALLPLTSVGELSPAFFVGLLQALISFLFGNLYVNGINQLFDVEIDKINKPHFVLASGELSMGQGKAITSAFGVTCLAMGIMFQSPPLFIGIVVFFLLGTAYSVELPLLRWKTNPFLAVICIVGAQGFTLPPAVFFHIQHVLGKPLAFTKSFGFATMFSSLFALVLALFKDIPDVEGDRAFGNQTFSVTHGKKKVFSLCVSILLIAYGFAVVIGASSTYPICKLVSVIGHLTLASFLFVRGKSLNLDDNVSTQSFYKLLWKMLCAEYVLIHFIS